MMTNPNGSPASPASASADLPAPAVTVGWRGSFLRFFRLMGSAAPAHWMLYDALAAALAFGAIRMTVLALYSGSRAVAAVWELPSHTGARYAVAPLAAVLAGNVLGLYERRTLLSRINLLLALGGVALAMALAVALFQNIVLYQQIGRLPLAGMAVLFACVAGLPRLLGHYAMQHNRTRIMAVADTPAARTLARSLHLEEPSYEFVGYCGDRRDPNDAEGGDLRDLPRLCRERGAEFLVVTRKYVDNPNVLAGCFEVASTGCEVLHEGVFFEEFLEQVPPGETDKGLFFQARIGHSTRSAMALKRACDIALALAGLSVCAAAAAVLAPVALAAWLALGRPRVRPILFTQLRCGQYGRPFVIYKLRTMRTEAEAAGPQWAVDNDPRVTRLGRILRATRVDELPQFWNVLRGDMSFIGPRPELPELVREIERSVPYFSFRHWARPGLTGLAQVRFRYAATMEDAKRKLAYDLYYIKNWSLFLDLRILLRTVSAFAKGAR